MNFNVKKEIERIKGEMAKYFEGEGYAHNYRIRCDKDVSGVYFCVTLDYDYSANLNHSYILPEVGKIFDGKAVIEGYSIEDFPETIEIRLEITYSDNYDSDDYSDDDFCVVSFLKDGKIIYYYVDENDNIKSRLYEKDIDNSYLHLSRNGAESILKNLEDESPIYNAWVTKSKWLSKFTTQEIINMSKNNKKDIVALIHQRIDQSNLTSNYEFIANGKNHCDGRCDGKTCDECKKKAKKAIEKCISELTGKDCKNSKDGKDGKKETSSAKKIIKKVKKLHKDSKIKKK